MYLLLSGEGASDIGVCNNATSICSSDMFSAGPMTLIIDILVECTQGYDLSHLDTERVTYVSESYLAENKPRSSKKALSMPGKKKSTETKYYYENARTLAIKAKSLSDEVGDSVVAVLFRDSDGTASAGRGDWANKRQSMLNGFLAESFDYGVAMMPKPKSEAWLLCATKVNPYQHCARLEDAPGNDNVDNSLKSQLDRSLNGQSSAQQVNALLLDNSIDIHQVSMPSFDVFKEDLAQTVHRVMGGRP